MTWPLNSSPREVLMESKQPTVNSSPLLASMAAAAICPYELRPDKIKWRSVCGHGSGH